jgi:hypothetical protein
MALAGLVVLLLATGCTARVTGMTSPVAHDYAVVQWQALDGEVRQPFLVGPGYSAAFENDPRTTPGQLVERYEALPADAAEGRLVELRVGARPEDAERAGPGTRVGIRYAPERDPRFPEFVAADWPDAHVWLPELADGLVVEQTFLSPYPLLDGIVVRTATFWGDLTPGEALIGPAGATVFDTPYLQQRIATLDAGSAITVTGSTEGYGAVTLADGRTGYVQLDAFAELPPPGRSVSGPLVLDVLDAGGNIVRSAAAQRLCDNAHLELRFPALPDSQGQRYTLRLSMPNAEANQAAALRATRADVYRDGELRLAGELVAGDLIFRPLHDSSELLFDAALETLARDGDWALIEEPPPLAAGTIAELVLWQTGDPSGWEYGSTPGRGPYGGWLAEVPSTAEPIAGAISFETVYEREFAVEAVVGEGFDALRAGVRDDPWFAVFYGGALVVIVGVATLLLLSPRKVEGLSDGS